MNSQSQMRQESVDDEIDLVDLWLNVRRYRLQFFLTMVLSLIVGATLAIFLPAKYEHTLILELGGIEPGSVILGSGSAEEFQFVELPASVQIKVEEKYSARAIQEIQARNPELSIPDEMQVDVPEGAGVIRMNVSGSLQLSSLIFEVLNSTAAAVIEEHAALLSRRIDLAREVATERLHELDAQLRYMNESREQVARSGERTDKGMTLLLIDTKIQQLSAERSNIERQLKVDLQVNAKPTRIAAGPLRDNKPETPGPVMTVVLSIVVGTVLGFLVVVIATLRRKANERQRAG